MTLQPSASIGFHRHEHNEDTYIIVSGIGLFTDSDGKSYQVTAGDVTIARKGQSHALANIGKEPLVFIDCDCWAIISGTVLLLRWIAGTACFCSLNRNLIGWG